MANPIDLIITQDALKGLDTLISKLTDAREKTLSLGEAALGASKSYTKVNTPSALNNNTALNAQVNADIKKNAAEIEKSHATIAKAAEKSRLAEIRLQQAREKAFDSYNVKASKEAALVEKQSGAYYKLDLAHKKALLSAQNIGAQYGVTSREFIKASQTANKLDIELKQIDATLGKSQRNVGNYKSAFNGLGNALNQLGFVGGVAGAVALGKNIFETTKELISLDNALKLVTGTSENFAEQQAFLAKISEDFGTDINGLTKQFTQFYVSAKDKLAGNEIQDIFRSVTKAGASMGLSVQSQERAFLALNQMMSKGTIQAEELRGQLGEALPGAFGIMAKAVGVTEKELAAMMKSGQLLADEVLPKFARQLEITYGIENVKRIDNLASAQTRLSNSWTNFVRSLDEDGNTLSNFFSKILGTLSEIVKGTTLLFQSAATKQQSTFKNLRQKGYDETLQYYNSLDELNKKDIENVKNYTAQKIVEARKETESLRGRNLILKALQRDTPLGEVETSENKAERIANENRIKDLNNVTYSYYGQLTALNSLLDPKKKIAKLDQDETNNKKEKIKAIKLETVSQLELSKTEDTALERLKTLKRALEQTRDETSKNSTEFQQFETSIKGVNESIDFLTKGIAPIKLDIKTPFVEGTKAVNELNEATKNWLKSFETEFLQNSGFGSLETFFDGTFDKLLEGAETTQEKFAVYFNAIAESAQEAFNFISNISQQKFAEETARVESQYQIALGFANGNAEAEAKLAEDLAERKKDIANRENKVKQKQAIFNIAIDTAQAIVASLRTDPTGILALIIGALGAVQIGVVASQQIPQYFDGGVHDGGLAMINDAGGSNYVETVVTPDGKARQFKGRDVVTNLPKGTEIFTPEQWHEKQLFDMMQSNNIGSYTIKQQNNGLTAQDMDRVIGKHFSKIQVNNTTFDVNGMRTWSENNGNRTIRDAKRVSRTGYTV